MINYDEFTLPCDVSLKKLCTIGFEKDCNHFAILLQSNCTRTMHDIFTPRNVKLQFYYYRMMSEIQ